MSKFCTSCGTQLNDDAVFCTNCGASQTAMNNPQQQQPTNSQQPQPQYQQVPPQFQQAIYVQTSNQYGESHWDGGVLETFCALLVTNIIILFTCGIATPWAICYLWKYIISHTVVDGMRLTFDGTGAQLFGNWIKWFLLIVITCGIYSFWVYPRLFHWVAKHTHFYA